MVCFGSTSRAWTTLGLACALAIPTVASAQEPFSFDRTAGKLPKTVVPLDYAISIVPDVKRLVVTGSESVTLDVRQATTTIVFNSLHETLERVRLDGAPVAATSSDEATQLTTVRLARPARPGRHLLTFRYRGRIEQEPAGLFAQAYQTPAGTKGLMLSTQFEATDARRMFPCWDEPAFRASFRLTVQVPAQWKTVSNMPIARRVVHGRTATVDFRRTPRMPTYLLEFSAGDLAGLSDRQGRTRLGVWTVRGRQQEGAVALANARQILSDYDDYFAAPFPLPKLDAIAVPGGFTGAMENWGAITYNDRHLLVGPSTAVADRQRVYSIQAHEMAHQWFGDLVTMGWWDDIWLNESFASWMAARQTDLRHPEWNWWESEDGEKERAMSADARTASHPILQHVTNELEAIGAFDSDITYQKGEAVLHMLEWWLGPDRFRDGIRGYVRAHAYSNAATADLWQALGTASGQDVAAVAAGWAAQAGFPLVTVTASCAADGARTIVLSQQRFLLDGGEGVGARWRIPLRLRAGASEAPRQVLLTADGQMVPAGKCGEPLSINADAIGYYRVHYDEATLRANVAALANLPRGDRLALLDDQWSFVEAGTEPLSAWLDLASALGARVEERSWSQVTEALGRIEYAERGTPGHEAFVHYAAALLQPIAAQLGWTSRPADTAGIRNLRQTVLTALGKWGDRAAIAEARRRFADLMADPRTLQVDDRAAVLSIVALQADATEFDQLHALAKSARDGNEIRRYYGALMQVGDQALARRAAAIALSDEIPRQEASARLDLVATLADRHPQLAWQTFTDNLELLTRSFGPGRPLVLATECPGMFWDALPAEELEAWVQANVPVELASLAARSLGTVRFRLREKSALTRAADSYLQSRQAAARG